MQGKQGDGARELSTKTLFVGANTPPLEWGTLRDAPKNLQETGSLQGTVYDSVRIGAGLAQKCGGSEMRIGLRPALVLAALLVFGVRGLADDAKASYKEGLRAEAQHDCDTAFQSYRAAYAIHPNEPKYFTAYLRTRSCAATVHMNNGVKLREDKKLAEAAAEFQKAAEIDETNFLAVQELRRTLTLIKKQVDLANAPAPEAAGNKTAPELEGPIELIPSPNTPISLRLTTTADNVYRTIGKLGGISVLFDLDYKPQKITIELNEVMMQEALRLVALESKTF